MGPKTWQSYPTTDNAKVVKNTLKALNWEIFSHPPYSPDLTRADYHLFASMGHSLAERRFANFEEVEKWLVEWFASKKKNDFPERWAKFVESNAQYFE